MLASPEAVGSGRMHPGRLRPWRRGDDHRQNGFRIQELGLREAVRDLRSEWREFRQRAQGPSPFLRPDYLALWAEKVGSPDRCRVVTARRAGELVGYGPFMVVDDPFGPLSVPSLRMIGNNLGYPGDVMYSDILAVPPRAPVVRSILSYVARWRAGRWDLGYVPPSSETCGLARETLGASGEGSSGESQSFVGRTLPRDWDGFLDGLSGEARRNFRRRLRRLTEVGPVGLRVAHSPAIVRRTVEELIRNHERWWRGSSREGWLGDERVKRFLVDAAGFLAGEGAFLAFALELNGEPIAWNIGAYDRGRYFEQIASFDRTYSACAPGVLLGMFVVRDLIEQRALRIELGPGFDERKRRLGGIPVEFDRLRGQRGWLRVAVAIHDFFRRPRPSS